MAKSDVILKFDAETATYVQKVLAAKDALESVANHSRAVGKEAEKAGSALQSLGDIGKQAGEGLVAALGTATTVAGGVATAVELVKGTIENMLRRTEENAERTMVRIKSLNESLAGAGQTPALAGVRAQIGAMAKEQIGGRNFSEQDITQAFTAISTQLGPRASAVEKLDATRAAMGAQASGMGAGDAANVGVNFANMRRQMPGATPTQLLDDAYSASVYMRGPMDEQSLKFMARSKNKEQAMGLLFAASQSDESAKGLAEVQQLADTEIDPATLRQMELEKRRHPWKWTEDQERTLRLGAIAPEDRFDAILKDQSLAPATSRRGIANLMSGMGRAPLLSYRAAMAASRPKDLEAHEGATDFTKRTQDQFSDADTMLQGVRDARWAIYERLNPDMSQVPGVRKLVENRPSPYEQNYARTVNLDRLPAIDETKNPAIPGFAGFQDDASHLDRLPAKNALELLQGIMRELEKGNKHQAEVVKNTRGREQTTLSNNSEGQK